MTPDEWAFWVLGVVGGLTLLVDLTRFLLTPPGHKDRRR